MRTARLPTSAVHAVAAWLLESERQTLRGELREAREAAYAPLVYGDPKEMVRFCLQEAQARLAMRLPWSNHRNEEAAGRWYEMAARFAWQAEAERRDDIR